MTTASALTPAETLARLEELLAAATERAAGEAKMERLRDEILEHEIAGWAEELEHFSTAVHQEMRDALSWHERDDSALQVCQDIQDAIDLLKFAMQRSDNGR